MGTSALKHSDQTAICILRAARRNVLVFLKVSVDITKTSRLQQLMGASSLHRLLKVWRNAEGKWHPSWLVYTLCFADYECAIRQRLGPSLLGFNVN
jgi:hypothetical protein